MTDLIPFFIQVLPIFLYAETHYRFRYFFSFLRKKEPEIIADAPHRIEPGENLPVLILAKDAHQFPVKLCRITVIIRKEGKKVIEKELLDSPIYLNEKLFWRVYEIALNGLDGMITCDVAFEINDGKNNLIYHNDNYRSSSRKHLSIFASPSPLPRFEQFHFGECHSHSSYTEDQVEFGAPLEASIKLSKALGLSFFCSTDHSYDLDDSVESYLENDGNLTKWRQIQKEIDELNKVNSFVIIRGEEVTCRNSDDENIHLVLLGNQKFFHGSGDGAEKWMKTRSENSISDILNNSESTSLSFAAHPREKVSFLQRILLGRGNWKNSDLNHTGLTGIQFANGYINDGFWEGYRQWIEALLEGKKMIIIAGNDAHGNFNRFRQIGIPFFKIREAGYQLFGVMRTGVFTNRLTENDILNSIKAGKAIISDGPIVNLTAVDHSAKYSSIGDSIIGSKISVLLDACSSTEYGTINSVRLLMGKIGASETVISPESSSNLYELKRTYSIDINTKGYIRAEIWTSAADSYDTKAHFCMTNPIWLSPE
ncbi:MAG: hypothetical protein JXA06_13960 [Bacteroidetes bacterium]|nr:hypothetical protein [Bacteroidota bacterium]